MKDKELAKYQQLYKDLELKLNKKQATISRLMTKQAPSVQSSISYSTDQRSLLLKASQLHRKLKHSVI
jgi:hypothetical protein